MPACSISLLIANGKNKGISISCVDSDFSVCAHKNKNIFLISYVLHDELKIELRQYIEELRQLRTTLLYTTTGFVRN